MAIHLDSSTVSLDKPILWAYRCLALLWIAKGYLGWFYLMTATTSSLHLVGHDGWVDLISMVVIPILDIIAGVSLWISWRWGSGVWAVIAFGYVCLEITEHTHVHSFILTTEHFYMYTPDVQYTKTLLWDVSGKFRLR